MNPNTSSNGLYRLDNFIQAGPIGTPAILSALINARASFPTVGSWRGITTSGYDVHFKSAPRIKMVDERSVQVQFGELVDRLKRETFFQSSLSKIFTHPAYQTIMAMGKEGLPFVLDLLRKGDSDWFYALKHMAREDVAEGARSFEEAKAAWLEWGYRHNYI